MREAVRCGWLTGRIWGLRALLVLCMAAAHPIPWIKRRILVLLVERDGVVRGGRP